MDEKIKMLITSFSVLWNTYNKTQMTQYRKEKLRITLLKLYIMYKMFVRKKRRNIWVTPIYTIEQRYLQGDSDNLLVTLLRENDESLYFNYLRMPPDVFDALLHKVTPFIIKQYVVRKPICAHTRLQVCLRYLASGDSMKSVSYAFRIAPNTVAEIIEETCDVIWRVLRTTELQIPSTEKWLQIAEEFENKWNFPNCFGALDGKHIVVEAPPYSRSIYYNYKKTHSFNLTATSDANYRFILIDVGAEGRRSDGGVFANSKIKQYLDNGKLNLPAPAPVGNYDLPFVLVADEAYPLSCYIMRPYPRRNLLTIKEKVFNYRLSRARRMIESSFGILVARWRIYRRPINTYIRKAEKMVLATVCLHNFIITKELQKCPQKRRYLHYTDADRQVISLGLTEVPRVTSGSINQENPPSTHSATDYREMFANYFLGEGAVSWQWQKAAANKF